MKTATGHRAYENLTADELRIRREVFMHRSSDKTQLQTTRRIANNRIAEINRELRFRETEESSAG